MSRIPGGIALLVACGTFAGPGCTTVSGPPVAAGGPSPSLVMPGTLLRGGVTGDAKEWPVDNRDWEYGRNDEVMSVRPTPPYRDAAWAEIRTRDHTRTVNGRPREFSTTFVRSVTLRVVR